MSEDEFPTIEIGETYAVSAYYKKSMIEIEQFKNEETGKWLTQK